VPDSTFSVYAAVIPSLHTWKESDLTWADSPLLTGETPDQAKFIRLAGFTILKGSANTLLEIESDEFSRFLLSSEDRFVTLLLVRESTEFDKQGLVHSFASKEHPSAPAPTLWFQPNPRP